MPELRTIQLSSRLTNMSRNAFVRCPKLDSILFRSYAPPAYEEDESIAHAGLTILVPEGAESMYKRNSMWSQYASYIKGVRYTDLAEPDYYLSKDYSQDGLVHTLQTAAKGQGIDIVLMGDGFSDRQIADGTYAGVMELMADAFFTDEPYKSYRDLFNVYAVNVVSATEGYEQAGQALGTYIGTGSIVGGSDTQCMAYARNAVSDDRMENTLIIVAMNSKNGGGTCYMYSPQEWKDVDFGCGMAVSYFATGSDDFYLARVLIHEAGGHDLAGLVVDYGLQVRLAGRLADVRPVQRVGLPDVVGARGLEGPAVLDGGALAALRHRVAPEPALHGRGGYLAGGDVALLHERVEHHLRAHLGVRRAHLVDVGAEVGVYLAGRPDVAAGLGHEGVEAAGAVAPLPVRDRGGLHPHARPVGQSAIVIGRSATRL